MRTMIPSQTGTVMLVLVAVEEEVLVAAVVEEALRPAVEEGMLVAAVGKCAAARSIRRRSRAGTGHPLVG